MTKFARSQYIATVRAAKKLDNAEGKQMLVALAEMADESGKVRRVLATAKIMAARCGINEQTSRRYLVALRDKKLISITHVRRKSFIQLADEDKVSALI